MGKQFKRLVLSAMIVLAVWYGGKWAYAEATKAPTREGCKRTLARWQERYEYAAGKRQLAIVCKDYEAASAWDRRMRKAAKNRAAAKERCEEAGF